MRRADEILADLAAARDDACRLFKEQQQNYERKCRLIREAREHPELSVERAGEVVELPRRSAYEYAKAADEWEKEKGRIQ